MTLTRVVNGIRENIPALEQAEIEAEWDENLQARQDHEAQFGYLDRRREAYPAQIESIEAIFEGFRAINNNLLVPLPASTLAWIDQMQTIYDANPEP